MSMKKTTAAAPAAGTETAAAAPAMAISKKVRKPISHASKATPRIPTSSFSIQQSVRLHKLMTETAIPGLSKAQNLERFLVAARSVSGEI